MSYDRVVYAIPRLLQNPAEVARLAARVARLDASPALRDAKLKLTSRCNLGCQMCDYWRTTRETTLSLKEWRGILDQLAALSCQKVHVSGGEPFLRPDLLESDS